MKPKPTSAAERAGPRFVIVTMDNHLASADQNTIGQPHTIWSAEAEEELKKIPFFVRGRARGNTETFARELGLATITVNTLYEAKAHFGR